jgi:hypothetical protein
MKIRIVLTISLVAIISIYSNAQPYNTAIGLRLGPYYGLTLKHNLSQSNALEGILSTTWNEFMLVGLYQVHRQAFDLPTMRWYFGGGAHVGAWGGGRYVAGQTGFILGASGVLGIEYNFDDLPLNISLDWLPSFDLLERFGPRFNHIGLSVRYMIR